MLEKVIAAKYVITFYEKLIKPEIIVLNMNSMVKKITLDAEQNGINTAKQL